MDEDEVTDRLRYIADVCDAYLSESECEALLKAADLIEVLRADLDTAIDMLNRRDGRGE